MEKIKDFIVKNKKILLIVAAVVAVLIIGIIVTVLLVNNNEPAPTEPSNAVKMDYTVVVQTKAGEALEGVNVFVYADASKADMVWVSKTDAEGKVSFTEAASENYIAVLEDVPVIYAVEESYPLTGETTTIVLEDATINENNMDYTFAPGDQMLDFTVTDCDGVEYTLSNLLQEKKAVVLNFWYLNCKPCQTEFPYLQEAYNQFSSEIEVLALNPVDGDDADIAAFKTANGLTFPMAKCDPRWEKMMQLTAYPTTVVIDRDGTISMFHSGMITETQTFLNIFAFFSAEDYEHTIVENFDELPTYKIQNSADNPLEISGVTNFQVTVEAGQVMYVAVYRVSDMLLQIQNENAYVIYNDHIHEPMEGEITFMVESPDPFTPVALAIGNNSDETQTFTVNFSYPEGSSGNPHQLVMGEFTADVAAGNDQGVFYSYTAVQDGKLTIQVLEATSGVEYDCALNNMTTFQNLTLSSDGVVDSATGITSLTMDVKTGDVIMFSVSTFLDTNAVYPAVSVKLNASYDNGGLAAPIAYTVNVKNDSGKGVPNVLLQFIGGEIRQNVTTNASGVATLSLPAGNYTCKLTVPNGYTTDTTSYELTETANQLTITLEKQGSGNSGNTTNPSNPTTPSNPTNPTNPTNPSNPGGSTEPTVKPDPDVPGETKDNPIDFWTASEGETSAEITVRSGWTAYVQVNRIFDMNLVIESNDVQVIYKGKTYKPNNGKVSVYVNAETSFDLLDFQIKNTGSKAKTFTLKFISPSGSLMDPYGLKIGQFTANVPAGSNDGIGIFYQYTATKKGVLTVRCKAKNGVDYNFYLQNKSLAEIPNATENGVVDGDGYITLSVDVKRGDVVIFNIGTLPASGNDYPAGEFDVMTSLD